jgi:GT2 family glycosyltransferase
VIVATYRRPASLRATLQSLLRQSQPPLEIIVAMWSVDPPSHAVVEEIRSALAPAATPLVRGVQVPENRVASKENAGIQAAAGDILCFIDDDAVAPPDWLERLAAHYADPAVAGVGGRDIIRTWDTTGEEAVASVGRVSWFGRVIGNHHKPSRGVRQVAFLKGCNMSYRREAVRLIDPLLVGEIPYGFEIDMGLGTRPWGRLLYDPTLTVDHYPSSDMAAQQPTVARVTNHNQTYVLLKHLPAWGRIAFLAYTFALGDRNTIGLLRVPWLWFGEHWGARALGAHFSGKWAGVRSFVGRGTRHGEQVPAPIPNAAADTDTGISSGR